MLEAGIQTGVYRRPIRVLEAAGLLMLGVFFFEKIHVVDVVMARMGEADVTSRFKVHSRGRIKWSPEIQPILVKR
jgi:hypothetical protein